MGRARRERIQAVPTFMYMPATGGAPLPPGLWSDGTNLRHLMPSRAASCKPWSAGIHWKRPLMGELPPGGGASSRRSAPERATALGKGGRPLRRREGMRCGTTHHHHPPPPAENRCCCCGWRECCCYGRPRARCQRCCSTSRRAARASQQVAPGTVTRACRLS